MKKMINRLTVVAFLLALITSCEKEDLSYKTKTDRQSLQNSKMSVNQDEAQKFSTLSNVMKTTHKN